MGQPVISVIIPVYNAENYIVECARSLLGQTYRNIEFIFIDDCSTDSSFKKLEMVVGEYPGLNVRIVRHSENKGAAASRNDGLSLATGDYIGFVDADDWIEPEMYERMCREMSRNKADVVVCGYYRDYADRTEEIMPKPVTEESGKTELIRNYLAQSLTPLWNMLVKADLLKEHRIRFLDGFDWCEDFNVSSKVYYYSNNICFLDEPLYHYRDNLSSYCHTVSVRKYVSRLRNVLDLYDFFKDKEIYGGVKKSLFYRILLSKQFYLYETKEITAYMTLCPEANGYILSNPLYGKKSKLVEWLAVKLYALIVKLAGTKI